MKKLKVLGCYGIPTNAEIAGINSALEDNDLERALDIVKESKTLTAIFIQYEEDGKSKIVFYYCGEIYNDFSDVKKWQKPTL